MSRVRSRLGPSGSSYRPLSEFIAAEQQRRAFRESHQFAESATDWLTLSSTDHDSPSIFSRASTGVTAGSSVPPQSLVSQGETFVAASPLSSRRISIGATTSPLSLVSQGETFVAASPLSSRRVSIGATSSSPSLVSQGETTGPTIRVSTRVVEGQFGDSKLKAEKITFVQSIDRSTSAEKGAHLCFKVCL